MSASDPRIESYLDKFRLFEESLNGESASPTHATRRAAIRRFAELGFPTTKNEEWRFTNVAPIASRAFAPVLDLPPPEPDFSSEAKSVFLPGLTGPRLVFLDGRFSGELSSLKDLPQGLVTRSLEEALRSGDREARQALCQYAPFEKDAFTALNTGFLLDGAFIRVDHHSDIKDSLYLVFIATGRSELAASYPRTLILVGAESSVSVIEHYVSLSEGCYFTNQVSEILLGEGSRLEHTKIQTESREAFHIGSLHARLEKDARFTSNLVSMGGALVRNNVSALLDAEGIECTLNGITLAAGRQHVDNHTTIDHARPHSSSHEFYKAILDGTSEGVFNGKIFVRPDAQKTDAKQTNKTLLLSDGATMNAKPQLEIFADDVKCTHGAAIGSLDAEAMFYLRSRGISTEDARDILTYAFAADVTERIANRSLQEHLNGIFRKQLGLIRTLEEL